MKFLYRLFLWLPLLFVLNTTIAQQQSPDDTTSKFKLISAGPQYKRSALHKFLWGKNYRKEWSTPIQLPVLLLDDTKGGLIPQKEGGGHQTTSLHLETKDGKEYTLRSVDKRLGKVLPENFRGTFIEAIANDEVSMSHPYGAITVPIMADAAGIYHTNPEYVYVPRQQALDSFNEKVGNNVYLFEQKIEGDWSNAANLGSFDKFYGTDEVMQKLQDETENTVDQEAFLKARLFDMLIGDWDRHEKQWEWGVREKGKKKIFVPVPQDRDQAYFKHNGVLLDAAIFYSGMKYFQSFKDRIHNVKTLTYEERGLDRLFLNELTKTDWEKITKQLQASLTNQVIETAVKKLPPKIFAISGKKIISNLKSRRDRLLEYSMKYYLFLTKEVEIVGTKGTDYFEVKRLNDNETSVNLYNINKEGSKVKKAYYSRVFLTKETNVVRLFGLSGNDVYTTEGKVKNGIRIRMIGGFDRDSMLLNSVAGNKTKTIIYDDTANYVESAGKIRKRLSEDSSIHEYTYRSYVYDKRGFKPSLFYSMADRVYLGLSYRWEHHNWKTKTIPYVFKQGISVHYSITQRAFSFTYSGIFPHTIGKWDLGLLANYDLVRWTNFYGLGNESVLTTKDRDFNRMRSKEGSGNIELSRKVGNSNYQFNVSYRSVKIINDESRYTAKIIAPLDLNVFAIKSFGGVNAGYSFSKTDDPIVPEKGLKISAGVSFTQNLKQTSRSFWKYGGNFQLYLPLVSKFSLAISGGIESVDGDPEFYQYPSIGGGQNLRGFQLQRFYGKTAFYNSNELRFISKVKSYLFSGKVGLLGFVDNGRVWLPSEKSNTLHVGYGGGIIIAPFNFMFFDITYGFSDEDKLLQLRLNMQL